MIYSQGSPFTVPPHLSQNFKVSRRIVVACFLLICLFIKNNYSPAIVHTYSGLHAYKINLFMKYLKMMLI